MDFSEIIKKEGDRKEWTDDGDGGKYTCLIRRIPTMGHLCGYVSVPKGHPFHSTEMYEVRRLIGCTCPEMCRGECGTPYKIHGGITWNGDFGDEEGGKWFVGFDCTHQGDLAPTGTVTNVMDNTGFRGLGDMLDVMSSMAGGMGLDEGSSEGEYRDMNFVEENIKILLKAVKDFAIK